DDPGVGGRLRQARYAVEQTEPARTDEPAKVAAEAGQTRVTHVLGHADADHLVEPASFVREGSVVLEPDLRGDRRPLLGAAPRRHRRGRARPDATDRPRWRAALRFACRRAGGRWDDVADRPWVAFGRPCRIGA